jgi:hypothetical protein
MCVSPRGANPCFLHGDHLIFHIVAVAFEVVAMVGIFVVLLCVIGVSLVFLLPYSYLVPEKVPLCFTSVLFFPFFHDFESGTGCFPPYAHLCPAVPRLLDALVDSLSDPHLTM